MEAATEQDAETADRVEPAASSAAGEAPPPQSPTGLVVEYYHLDALGSVRAVTNADGFITSRHDYMPFGEEIAPAYPPPIHVKFTGQERDSETNQDYLHARYLKFDVGRFTTVDPISFAPQALGDPQGYNTYAYAFNSPCRYVDPTGLLGQNVQDILTPIPAPGGITVDVRGEPGLMDPIRIKGAAAISSFLALIGEIGLEIADPSEPQARAASPSLFTKVRRAVTVLACSAQADVLTVGVGGDIGIGAAPGAQIGLAANGNSGELSLTVAGGGTVGMISYDSYLYAGSVKTASTNGRINSGRSFDVSYSAGISRIGGSRSSPENGQVTFGPSLFPATSAVSLSKTRVLFTVPYIGYALNPLRTVCKAVGL